VDNFDEAFSCPSSRQLRISIPAMAKLTSVVALAGFAAVGMASGIEKIARETASPLEMMNVKIRVPESVPTEAPKVRWAAAGSDFLLGRQVASQGLCGYISDASKLTRYYGC
jgi:hypothetical protein